MKSKKKRDFCIGLIAAYTGMALISGAYADSEYSLSVGNVGSYESADEIVINANAANKSGQGVAEVTAELTTDYRIVLPSKIHLENITGNQWAGKYKVMAKGNILDSEYIEIKPENDSFQMHGTETNTDITAYCTHEITTMRNLVGKTDKDALFESGSGKFTSLKGEIRTSISKADRYKGNAVFSFAVKSDENTDEPDEEKSDLKYKLCLESDHFDIVTGQEKIKIWVEDENGSTIREGFYTIVNDPQHRFSMSTSGEGLMGHSDISVTMNVYTHLGFDDAKDEMIRLEELEAAKKEVEKVTGEKPISQKMFKAI